MATSDIYVARHNSIYLLHAFTDEGQRWLDEHIPGDAQRWNGAPVVEHRYIFYRLSYQI